MRKYTLEPVRLEAASVSPSLYCLYIDAAPTVIAISCEEAALLQHDGPNIERSALDALFECSPTRKENLDRIPL
jgi:hypothetical protein